MNFGRNRNRAEFRSTTGPNRLVYYKIINSVTKLTFNVPQYSYNRIWLYLTYFYQQQKNIEDFLIRILMRIELD